MNPDNCISKDLAKKLNKNGCEVESEMYHFPLRQEFHSENEWTIGTVHEFSGGGEFYPAYDLLWDICVRHADKFFGEEHTLLGFHTDKILTLIQQGKKQEAEEYFWEHTVFNPKNK